MHIKKSQWGGLGFNIYNFSGDNEGIAAPGVSDFILATVVSGSVNANYNFNGAKWSSHKLHKGTTVLLDKHNTLTWQWKERDLSSEPLSATNLILDNNLVHQTAIQVSDMDFVDIEMPNNICSQDPFLYQLAQELKSEAENNTPYGKLFGQTAAQLLAVHLLRKHVVIKPGIKEYTDGLDRSRLQQVTDYINDNLHQEINLDRLAVLAGMSNYHFARLFKQSTGMAPHKYVMGRRMEKAKELLQHTNLSISQISSILGYESQSHLAKLFKRYSGLTPTMYRSQCK